ncbi:MAG TPA: MFS transporter [Planctomycetaceae bacterium]|nr:MFS transporter [Planctomycetaceae bacterium]
MEGPEKPGNPSELAQDAPQSPASGQVNPANTWAPLAFPMYRAFWFAGLFSNLGTWMHETGAQWVMASLDPSPEMVSAVRTAMTVPVLLLALPAGVWADQFDRRKWLLSTQAFLLVVATTMALLAWGNLMTPMVLLILTAAMGAAMVLSQPAWQALTPELVPAALVPTAVSVGSISFNLARAIGPALAGLLIASQGTSAAFACNAFSFLGIITVLLLWNRKDEPKPKRGKPKFSTELKKGLFLIKHTEYLRSALVRVGFFALSASVLWSLISLVAKQKLAFAERGFGLSLGLIGAGAVIGAIVLPKLRMHLSSVLIVTIAQISYGLFCVIIALTDSPTIVLPCLFLIGGAWMTTMTTLNATAQVNLPKKFRARGMAGFLMCFALGMALGSMVWGWLGLMTSLDWAFILAGLALAATAVCTWRLDLGPLVKAS